jgi:hypothetical protein
LTALCVSACTSDETRCEKGQIRFCQSDAQGCARFSAPEACPTDKPLCSGDVCAAKCSDQCTSGARRCRDAGYQVCGKSDAGCLDFGPVLGCGAGETCRVSDGQCVLDCGGKPCTCKPGDTQICTNVGECKDGMRSCVSGEFGACEWQVGPTAETCDGKDNDCSGTPDDNLVAPACDKQQGVCQGAVKKCGGGEWLACTDSDYSAWATSKGLVYEAVETKCDGTDNDCNGKTDEPAGCCQPSCTGKACGASDGCGHACQAGSCQANATCRQGSCVCDVLQCGVACCASGEVCSTGQCQTANPGNVGYGELCDGTTKKCALGLDCITLPFSHPFCSRPCSSSASCSEGAPPGTSAICGDSGGYCGFICSSHGIDCPSGLSCFGDPGACM